MNSQENDTYAKAYVEILEIIKHMEQKYREKIPVKLIEFFEENKDDSYCYDLSKVTENQSKVFSQKTIDLLAMLELKYLANETERKILEDALKENDKIYQTELREKYNPDNLFKNKISKVETVTNSVDMVEYKESILTKIKNWFKRII